MHAVMLKREAGLTGEAVQLLQQAQHLRYFADLILQHAARLILPLQKRCTPQATVSRMMHQPFAPAHPNAAVLQCMSLMRGNNKVCKISRMPLDYTLGAHTHRRAEQ